MIYSSLLSYRLLLLHRKCDALIGSRLFIHCLWPLLYLDVPLLVDGIKMIILVVQFCYFGLYALELESNCDVSSLA